MCLGHLGVSVFMVSRWCCKCRTQHLFLEEALLVDFVSLLEVVLWGWDYRRTVLVMGLGWGGGSVQPQSYLFARGFS